MTRWLGAWAALLSACNVTAQSVSGGADLPERGDCPRGVAVVSSDYVSSEVALLFPSGKVASRAFLSSASSAASGLAAAFSGDIVVDAAPSRPGELVIVDRFGTNVLTFVDSRTAAVRAQLPVGTGFEANAQQYVEVDERSAYVPRLGQNAAPGREPFDAGSDLLVIDPSLPAVVGSVPLPRREGYLPAPSGVTQVGEDLLVTLQHARPDFSGMDDGELVGVSTLDRSIRYRLALRGSKNCGAVELSPSRKRLAVACEGYIDRKGAVLEPETSGLLLLDPAQDPPAELQRFSAVELFDGPIQASLEFVSDELLLVKTQTAQGSSQDNRLFSLRLDSGEVTLLARAARDPNGAGFGIAFGGMSCASGCGDPCFVADMSRGQLLRFTLQGGALAPLDPVIVGGAGLPPTGVTTF
ncbi:MAG TPA: hypothetical protein VEQ59_09650 [Polyangiaceae bacterium]|nr:hypothetical protein [Polyangiaceae bacterium]